MANESSLHLTRRSMLKALSAATAAPVASSYFVPIAAMAEEPVEYGYTVCDNCNDFPCCGIKFVKKGNAVISIEKWDEHPNKLLCSKALATQQRLYNPNRLLYPMKRTNPKGSADPGFVRISWEEALATIAKNLDETRKKYGPNSVLFICGDPKEPRGALMRLARYFGSCHYATESSIACSMATTMAEELVFGTGNGGGACPADSKSYMVMASNGAWSLPTGWWNALVAAKKRGVNIIVVDSRRTKPAEIATVHLMPKQGTDAALAAGICHVLFEEGLYNKEFCDKWVHGLEEYRDYCQQFTPEKTQEITGVPADLIVKAARLYAEGPGSFSISSQSLSHTRNGVNNARALLLIPAILGYIDVPGGALFSVAPKGSVGHHNGVSSDFFDKKWFLSQKPQRLDKDFVPVWNHMEIVFSPNQLPELVKAGKLKAMASFGLNVMIWPQPDEYKKAIRDMDFSCATDYFYRPITHDEVDILLPAAMNFERYAPFIVAGDKVVVKKPVKPLGEAKEDWWIILQLGCLLDSPERFFNGDVVKACDSILVPWGTSYEAAQKNLPKLTVVECPKQQPYKYEKGLMRPDGKPGFNTPTGKIELVSEVTKKLNLGTYPEYMEPWQPTPEYPIKMLNGPRTPYIAHSRTRTDSPILLELESMSTININPEDAAARGIKEGDLITIKNQYGQCKGKARVTILVPKGTASMNYGWQKDQNSQNLIPRVWDKLSGYGPYYETTVEITKDAKEA